MLRREDSRLLTGAGQFIDDQRPDDTLYGVILRSPIAHATLTKLDTADALQMPGVLAILTAEDLDKAGVQPLASRMPVTGDDGQPMREPTRPVLADKALKYVGQPIAFVVAKTEFEAMDALEAIELDYDPLSVIADVDDAVAENATRIWPDIPENTAFTWRKGNGDAVNAAIASAAHVFELRVDHPRLAISPVETRGAIGQYDTASNRYTLETPSQGVVSLRAAMADTLGVATDEIRVVTKDVGGSFAVKIWPYPEHVLCLVAARLTGKSVKWISSRTEAFISDAHGRGRRDTATLALDESGKMVAFRIDALADMGAFLNAVAPSIVTAGAVRVFGHNYNIPAMEYRVRAVYTNAPTTDAYRGAGKPESVGTLERLLDVAARRLGMDRIELRRKNLIQPEDIPHNTPMAESYDGGNFPVVLDEILKASDWAGFEARKAASADNGLKRGIGLGFHMHATGGSIAERSKVELLPEGIVRVRTGTQDSGQGHQTALAQVAAEALGLGPEKVIVEQGDSDVLAVGGGTGGSNLLPIAANTVHRATLQMIENARSMAGQLLEAATEDIEYEAGTMTVAGTDRRLSLAELAARLPEIPADARLPGQEAGCVGELDFEGLHSTFPNGCYVAEAEVDPETGVVTLDRFVAVDDLGRILNEPMARGQLLGGIGQAIGECLMETADVDRESGQPISGSLMDYALPRAYDMPAFSMSWSNTDSPNSILGVKGAGEVSSIGAPGAITNAVLDALADDGIEHLDIPLTPQKIWSALNTKEG